MHPAGKLSAAAGLAATLLGPAASQASSLGLPIATDVNVINTPAVTVNNSAANPVPVRDVDRAAQEPVSGECAAVYGTVTNLKQCALYTVPAGKRLVVETVTYQLGIENTAFPYGATFGNTSAAAVFTFAPTFVGNDGINHYANAVSTRFYLGPGETLSAFAQFSAATIYGQRFAFSGYLLSQ
jgi:hypothetical protein